MNPMPATQLQPANAVNLISLSSLQQPPDHRETQGIKLDTLESSLILNCHTTGAHQPQLLGSQGQHPTYLRAERIWVHHRFHACRHKRKRIKSHPQGANVQFCDSQPTPRKQYTLQLLLSAGVDNQDSYGQLVSTHSHGSRITPALQSPLCTDTFTLCCEGPWRGTRLSHHT